MLCCMPSIATMTSATSACASAGLRFTGLCVQPRNADSAHRPPASGEKAQHLHDALLGELPLPESTANFKRVTDMQGRRRWRRLRGCSGCRRAAIRATPLWRKALHSGSRAAPSSVCMIHLQEGGAGGDRQRAVAAAKRQEAHHLHDSGPQRLVHQPAAQVGRPYPCLLRHRDRCTFVRDVDVPLV